MKCYITIIKMAHISYDDKIQNCICRYMHSWDRNFRSKRGLLLLALEKYLKRTKKSDPFNSVSFPFF